MALVASVVSPPLACASQPSSCYMNLVGALPSPAASCHGDCESGSITSKAGRRGDRVRGGGTGEGQASCASSWPGPHGFEEPRGVSEVGLGPRVAPDLFSAPPDTHRAHTFPVFPVQAPSFLSQP